MKRQKLSKKTNKRIFRQGIPVKTINFEVPDNVEYLLMLKPWFIMLDTLRWIAGEPNIFVVPE